MTYIRTKIRNEDSRQTIPITHLNTSYTNKSKLACQLILLKQTLNCSNIYT